MRRELTILDLFAALLVFAGSAGAFVFAFLAFFDARDGLAAVFAAGGAGLAVWAGARATRAPRSA